MSKTIQEVIREVKYLKIQRQNQDDILELKQDIKSISSDLENLAQASLDLVKKINSDNEEERENLEEYENKQLGKKYPNVYSDFVEEEEEEEEEEDEEKSVAEKADALHKSITTLKKYGINIYSGSKATPAPAKTDSPKVTKIDYNNLEKSYDEIEALYDGGM